MVFEKMRKKFFFDVDFLFLAIFSGLSPNCENKLELNCEL